MQTNFLLPLCYGTDWCNEAARGTIFGTSQIDSHMIGNFLSFKNVNYSKWTKKNSWNHSISCTTICSFLTHYIYCATKTICVLVDSDWYFLLHVRNVLFSSHYYCRLCNSLATITRKIRKSVSFVNWKCVWTTNADQVNALAVVTFKGFHFPSQRVSNL